MSSIILFVKIANVSDPTYSSTDDGVYLGNALWSSCSGITNYASGIMDERTVSGMAAACNIATGGTLGGFDGDVNFSAIGNHLMVSTLSNIVSLIGKTVTISVGFSTDPSSAILRYTGIIGTWEASDEITIDITCKQNSSFNKQVIPSETITKLIALNVEGSNAIGKSVTTTYGDVCDFPLVVIPSSAISYAFSITSRVNNPDNSAVVLDCLTELRTPDGNIMTTASGEYKGVATAQIYGIFQDYPDQNIWVCLSVNGNALFSPASSDNSGQIKSTFFGMSFKCVRGSGEGKVFKILDVAWASHEIRDGYSVATIWFQVNSINKSDLKQGGGILSTSSISATVESNYQLLERIAQGLYTVQSPYFIASNSVRESWTAQMTNIVNDISYIELCSYDNIFSVSKSANILSCSLIGIDKNGDYVSSYNLPAESIDILYETNQVRLIKININKLISDEQSSFGFSRYIKKNTYVHEVVSSSIKINGNGWQRFSGTYAELLPFADSFVDQYRISDSGSTSSIGATNSTDHSYTIPYLASTLLTPIEDLIDWFDISIEDFQISAIPKIKFTYTPNTSELFISRLLNMNIGIHVIGEGNISFGYVNATIGGLFNDGTNAFIEIDPDSEVVRYSDNYAVSFSEYSKNDYSILKEKLDISSLIKMSGIKRIRYIHTTIFMSANSQHYDSVASFDKVIYPIRLSLSKKIAKDKLFLRANRESIYENPTSPINLASSIAVENNILFTEQSYTSFSNASASQRALYSNSDATILPYDGQYQPGDNTSVSDALSDIAKQSMTAIFTTPDGAIQANWFADKDASSTSLYTFTDVKKGSMKITKQNNGYRYTDFVYSIKKNPFQNPEMLYVNTDSTMGAFPSGGSYARSGPVYQSSTGWEITKVKGTVWDDSFGSHFILGMLAVRSNSLTTPMLVFTKGTKWVLTDMYNNERVAMLTIVAVNPITADGYSGARLGFTVEGSSFISSDADFLPSKMQLYGPEPTWKSLVSGTFVSDYTTAKNIWDHANDARKELGCERAMPSTTTTLSHPIWGSDERALMQWVLYTTIFCTREKTVISFTVDMNATVCALWLMDYVEFAWGPYSTAHTKGWIVDIQDDYKNGVINFKILTSVSDSDVLLLDERTNEFVTAFDSTTSDFTNTYDQGALA
jgi:hypothetical protein